jgi:hypothetical protein
MSLALLLFQAASPTPTPLSTPEKFPAWLTLIYVSGFAVVALLLIVSLIRNRPFRSAATVATAPGDLPKEVRKRLGATTTNRGLRAWRWLFAIAAIFVFGFHVYWARYAPDQNAKFQELSYKDLRNRRLSSSAFVDLLQRFFCNMRAGGGHGRYGMAMIEDLARSQHILAEVFKRHFP